MQTTLKKLGHEIWIYDGVCEKTSFEKTLKRISPERFYTDAIDFIYRSDSMDDFAALVVELPEKKPCFETVNGLIYKKSGAWVQNALTQADINTLPIPDRTHFYENQNRYHYLELEKVSTIKTAFSCPHNCNFCYCTQLGGGIYRTRALSLVLEAIADADLVDYNKKTTEAINRACIENIHNSKAQIIALMMISHKATERDFKDLFAWAKSNKLIYTTVSVFTPLPGTPIYDDYVNEITTTQTKKYDFLHLVLKPENMSKFKFYRLYAVLTAKLFWLGKKAGAFDFLFKREDFED